MRPRFLFAVALILILAAGIVLTGYLERHARNDLESDCRNEAALLYSHLLANIEPVDHAVLAMSGSPWISGALISNRAPDRDRTNAVLDRFQKSMDVSVSYLMNTRGVTVASSNRNSAESFVGKSYEFRPYFTDALVGKPGRYFAYGVVSRRRGYYASAPVRDDAGGLVGVAAIKKDREELEPIFRLWPHSYLVSPEGIIFLASEPRMVFRGLWSAAMEKRDEMVKSRQFGELNFEPLLQQEPVDASYLKHNGASHYAVRRPLPIAGWSLVFLKASSKIVNYRMFGVLATVFACLLALFGYVLLVRAEERRWIAEEQLKAEESWSKTFDAVGDLIAIIGADHRIKRINQAMALRLGMKPEDAAGRYCYELVHCTKEPIRNCPHNAVLETGERCSVEVAEANLGGEFTITASPLRNADCTIEGSVHVMHDITEQRIRERQIQSLNVRLQAIISASPLAIIILDLDAAVTLWNPAAERMLGWTEQEALARPLAILPEERQEEFSGILNTLRQGKSIVSVASQRRTRDGRLIDVSLSASPILDEAGAVQSYLCVFEDITERKRIEADLLTAQKLETVGLLAGGIAHDFNNTLNVICGNVALVQMLGGVIGRSAEMLKDAEAACEKAKELSVRLITFSRGGAPVLGRHPVREVVMEALNLVTKPDNISFEFGQTINSVIEADRRQIRQVLRHLLINATEAMPKGGVVRIHAQELKLEENEVASLPAGAYVRISVADQGLGIPAEHLPKIFDPYFSTKERFSDRGMGLGLAVCWSIVRKHGGSITVESTVGAGTVFYVYLHAG